MLLIDDRAHNGEVCSIDLSVSAAGLQGDYWVATGGSDGVCKLYSRNFDNARHHGGSALFRQSDRIVRFEPDYKKS